MDFLNNLNLQLINIDLDDIDTQVDKYKNQINDKFLDDFKSMFKNEYNGDYSDNRQILMFIDSEIEYLDKLMSFDKDIHLKDVLKKTNLITLKNYFNIKLEIQKLEKDKWTLIEYKENSYIKIKTLLNYYIYQTYNFFINTYYYLKQ